MCIDERVVLLAPNQDGNINVIYVNTPGGGTEFLEDEEIEQIIMTSNGTVRIDSHKLCGWGEFLFNQILNGEPDFNDGERNISQSKVNGVARIMNSILLAVDDQENVFLNKYQGSLEALGLMDSLGFINRARDYVIARARNEDPNDSELETLVLQAFVHGKTIKLATRFQNIHQRMLAKYEMLSSEEKEDSIMPPMVNRRLGITTNIDTLEEVSHSHIAKEAVINMTRDRVFTSRFQAEDSHPFFASVGSKKAYSLIKLIFEIMEGGHSDTRYDHHCIHIFFDDEQLKAEMKAELANLALDSRSILFHLIDKEVDPLPESK